MKLSEMKQILAEDEIQLTKSLGQNFLHDANQIERIVTAAELKSGDKVLEIGPGLGPLTERLLRDAERLLAIEKDQRLVEVLRTRLTAPNLEIIHADALRYLEEHRDWAGWKVVSNLPYSVASPILVEFAQAEHSPELIVATLQIEVAQRIAAEADDDDAPQRVVRRTVASAVEPVPGGLSRRRRQWCRSAHPGEARLAPKSLDVLSGGDHQRGAHLRSHPV
jgi:16S rRNA (adenine1518-N6/adenine1519-N6)-dimethyltransferase